VENGRPGIASVQGVTNPARLVCTFWASHLGILSELNSPKKSPDTFYSLFSLECLLDRRQVDAAQRDHLDWR
jgi:hypothetical protein